jgi:hypothetical protein
VIELVMELAYNSGHGRRPIAWLGKKRVDSGQNGLVSIRNSAQEFIGADWDIIRDGQGLRWAKSRDPETRTQIRNL